MALHQHKQTFEYFPHDCFTCVREMISSLSCCRIHCTPRLRASQSGGCMYVTCHFLPWWVIFHVLFSFSEILEFLLVRFTVYAKFKVWLTLFVLQGQAEGVWWITRWISWQLETQNRSQVNRCKREQGATSRQRIWSGRIGAGHK